MRIPHRRYASNSPRRAGIELGSIEIEGESDRPLDFLHLPGWKRTELSDDDGLLNDGDPFCLDQHRGAPRGHAEDHALRLALRDA